MTGSSRSQASKCVDSTDPFSSKQASITKSTQVLWRESKSSQVKSSRDRECAPFFLLNTGHVSRGSWWLSLLAAGLLARGRVQTFLDLKSGNNSDHLTDRHPSGGENLRAAGRLRLRAGAVSGLASSVSSHGARWTTVDGN